MSDFDFLSREALLGGLSACRSTTLLFSIESRVAYLEHVSGRIETSCPITPNRDTITVNRGERA